MCFFGGARLRSWRTARSALRSASAPAKKHMQWPPAATQLLASLGTALIRNRPAQIVLSVAHRLHDFDDDVAIRLAPCLSQAREGAAAGGPCQRFVGRS